MQCSGVHRGLGVHISKVRSATLDTWLPEQVSFMQSMGNEKSNSYWEAELPSNYNRNQIESFIRAKYEEKRWVPKQATHSTPRPEGKGSNFNHGLGGDRSTGYADKKNSSLQVEIPIKNEAIRTYQGSSNTKPKTIPSPSSEGTPQLVEDRYGRPTPKGGIKATEPFSGLHVEDANKNIPLASPLGDNSWGTFKSAGADSPLRSEPGKSIPLSTELEVEAVGRKPPSFSVPPTHSGKTTDTDYVKPIKKHQYPLVSHGLNAINSLVAFGTDVCHDLSGKKKSGCSQNGFKRRSGRSNQSI